MGEQPQSRTDILIFKLKNNRILAVFIVVFMVLTALVAGYTAIQPYAYLIFKTAEHKKNVSEYNAYDFLMEEYNVDSLKVHKSIHSLVARRDYEMHFIMPNNWDINEPIDGPAGLRFKSFYLPENAKCIISAEANIVCLSGLVNKKDTALLGSINSEESGYKKLAGIPQSSPNEGFCSLKEYVNYQISMSKKEKNFRLISNSPSLKILKQKNANTEEIEARRVKYCFTINNEKYYVMELITYIDDIGFVFELGAPEEKYVSLEKKFIEVTNTIYYSRM